MEFFLQPLTAFATFIFYYSLKTSVLITLVLIVQKALGRFLSANGLYLLWLAVVLSLLTPVGFKTVIPQPFFITVMTEQPVLRTYVAPRVQNLNSPSNEQLSSERHANPPQPASMRSIALAPAPGQLGWNNLLSLLWLGGAVLLLGVVMIRSVRFSRLVRQASPAQAQLQALLDQCRKETCCTTAVSLLTTPAIEAPLVSGCWHPVLLLPTGIEQRLTTAQLRHVFLHELMHVKRLDIAGNWLLMLLQCLYWFNPVIWLGFKHMRQDRELVCDAATLHYLGSRDGPAYGHTLLQLSQPQPHRFIAAHGIGIADSKSQLHRRISMIVQASFPARRQSALAGVLLLAFGGMALSKPVMHSNSSTPSNAAVSGVAVEVAAKPRADLTAPVPAVTAPPSQATAQTTVRPAPSLRSEKTRRPAATTEAVKSATDSPTPAPLLAMADATPAHVVAQTAELSSSQLTTAAQQETYPGWAAILELTQSIAAAKSVGLQSLVEWDAVAKGCRNIKDAVYSPIHSSKPCQGVFKAVRSGDVAGFWQQCQAFQTKYSQLRNDYTKAPESQFVNQTVVRNAMLGNYRDLTEFCSVETYLKHYPAFAAVLYHLENQDEKLPFLGDATSWPSYADGTVTGPVLIPDIHPVTDAK